MTRWDWRAYVAVGLILGIAHFLVPAGSAAGVIYLGLGISGVAAIVVGVARHHPERPLPWLLFAGGLAVFLVGDLFFYYYKLVRHLDRPFPSLADAFYLSSYPLLIAGLLLLIRSRSPGRNRASLIDASIVATGTALLSWVYLITPSFVQTDVALLDRLVSVAYPVMDVLLLAVAARLAVAAGTRPPAYWLVGLSIVCLLTADLGYAIIQLLENFELGTPFDAGWMGFYVFWGAAALHPSMRSLAEPVAQPEPRLNVARLGVLTLVVLSAPLVLAVEAAREEYRALPVIAVSSMVLFLLVVARLAGLTAALRATAARERTLRGAAAALVAATDREGIHAAAVDAARELVSDPDALVRLAVGTADEIAVVAGRGGPPVPSTSRLALPDVRGAAGAGGDHLRPPVREALALDGDVREVLVAEIGGQEGLHGAIVAASPNGFATGVAEGVKTLAAQVALALESAALTEDLHQRQSEARFRSMVQNASDVITVIDPDTTVCYQTPSVERVLGYDPDRFVGRRLVEVVHPEDMPRLLALCDETARRGDVGVPVEMRMRRADGSWLDVETVGNNLLRDPNVRGIVLTTRDVGERKRFERQLSHQAFHDALTGLANRALFTDRVEHALARRMLGRRPLAVLFLDLDDFKTINDSLGHAAGDELLVAVAERVGRCVRPGDTTARLGGDEFAVLLEDVALEGGATIAAQRIIDTLQQPLTLEGKEVFVHASLGIAFAGSDGTSAEELLRNADVAMYMAKSQGKGRYEVFESHMHAAALQRLDLKAALQRAVDNEEFVLHYQPIVVLATGRMVGVEALVRWQHEQRGLISPAGFTGLAEETGLIVPLGQWVLEEACRQARRWADQGGLKVSVNLSQKQLQQPGIVDTVATTLARSHLDPSVLTLEITESVVMHDVEATVATLHELRQLGVRLAIDDFGTGYSSLSRLRQLPIDELKIDKEFVDGIARRSDDALLVGAVVELSRTLGLETVAEGIEDAAQLQRLRQLHCDLGQGYFFSPPVTAGEVDDLLARETGTLADLEVGGPVPSRFRSGG